MQPILVNLKVSFLTILDMYYLRPIIIAIHVSCILCMTKDGSELLLLPKRIGQTILSADSKLNHLEYLALKESL